MFWYPSLQSAPKASNTRQSWEKTILYNILISWYLIYDILISWYPDILISWYSDILISWYMISWYMISWYPDILISWYLISWYLISWFYVIFICPIIYFKVFLILKIKKLLNIKFIITVADYAKYDSSKTNWKSSLILKKMCGILILVNNSKVNNHKIPLKSWHFQYVVCLIINVEVGWRLNVTNKFKFLSSRLATVIFRGTPCT